MSYRVIFKCDVCLEECGRDCMGLHFSNMRDFRLVPGTDGQGRHICLACCHLLREQLNELVAKAALASPSTSIAEST